MVYPKFFSVVFFVVLLAGPLNIQANSDIEELPSLTLEQAIEKALANNFELSVSLFETNKANARTFQAGRLPNPELSVEVENFGGSGELRQSDAIETTVMISQPFLLGGKRSKQKKVAMLEEEQAKWNLQSQRLKIINEVHKSFIDVLGAQEFVKLNRELVTLEEEVFLSVKERVQAGKISPIEEIKAKANLDAERLVLERSERSLLSACRSLSTLWGKPEPSFKAVSEGITAMKELPDLSTLSAKLSRNPDLARWPSELEKRKATLALEKSRRISDVEIGVGWRDFNESDDHAFLAGISIPLPLFDRNRGNVREAIYDVSKAKKEKASEELLIHAELWNVYNETRSAYSEVSALKNTIVPGMKKVLEAQQEGFRMGKFDYLEVLDAQRSFFEGKRNLLDALISYHKGIAELERLTGSEKPYIDVVNN